MLSTSIKILFFSLFFAYCHFLKAGGDLKPSGGRANALGNASVTIRDQWAFNNNISGIAESNAIHASFAFQKRYNLRELDESAFILVLPLSSGVTGLGLSSFGNAYYNHKSASLGYANKIDRVMLGIKINIDQLSIAETGTRHFLTGELGGIIELLPKLYWGSHISNFNQAQISHLSKEPYHTHIKTGFSYKASEAVMFNSEIAKNLKYKHSIRFGAEYTPIEHIAIRGGFSTNPFLHFTGIGITAQGFILDYSISMHPNLGLAHQISVSYKFSRQ